jgi:hypothetical protein
MWFDRRLILAATRSFVVAPAMSRLLRREHPFEGPFVEGYFAGSSDRVHLSVGPAGCHLRLSSDNPEAGEEVAEIPRLHAEALLNVCVGKLGFARVRLSDTPAIHVDHIIAPGPLDVVTIEFGNQSEADAFGPPVWAGPELTMDPSYGRRAMAVHGLPELHSIALSDAGLNAFLDLLERGLGGEADRSRAEISQPVEPPPEAAASFPDPRAPAAARPSSGQRSRPGNMARTNSAHAF